MKRPEEIALDVKRSLVREAIAAEISERGETSVGRVARRSGVDRAIVEEMMPVIRVRRNRNRSQNAGCRVAPAAARR